MIKYQMFMDERAQRIAKAEAKGKAEGIAERDREWTDWNNRRLDAAAKGQPFDEPPPLNTPPAPRNSARETPLCSVGRGTVPRLTTQR